MKKEIVLLPCSGIGKALGEMGRQAIYEVIEDLHPEDVTTVCLARLMIADPEVKALVQDNIVLTVDGCPQDCARKNVEFSGKKADRALRVIEVVKENPDLKPQGILELGEGGSKLVHNLAQRLKKEIDALKGKE